MRRFRGKKICLIVDRLCARFNLLSEMTMPDVINSKAEGEDDIMDQSTLIEVRCNQCKLLFPLRVVEKHSRLCNGKGCTEWTSAPLKQDSDSDDTTELPAIDIPKSEKTVSILDFLPTSKSNIKKDKKCKISEVPGPSTVGKDHLMTINGTAISASSFDRILNQEWLDDMTINYYFQVLLEKSRKAIEEGRKKPIITLYRLSSIQV
ncbi:uncharacterized protein LOC135342345 isoform X5 [Halichondria panicea]|uniref:uncharacterized protein LOC135342345 isoform X5 n=1 Tax=Halichondria panicea TaxID=6063 RepID=UPI00312BBD48